MRRPVTLLVAVFSFFLFDPRLFRRRQSLFSEREGISASLDYKKALKKRLERRYKNKKFKKRKKYIEKTYRLKGSQSKDSRYSNQRSLRRMYQNC